LPPPSEPGPAQDHHSGRGPKPIIFDPFDTPFAIVETNPNELACRLPEVDAAKWMAVPPRPFVDVGQKPAATPPPRKFDGDATAFCVYKWRNEKTLPTRDDFKKIGAIPDGAVVRTRDHAPSKIPDLPDTVSGPLLKTFAKVARGIDPSRWQALAKAHLDRPSRPVKVAVIDATPKDLNTPDHSLHGFSVSRVIGSLLCRDVNSAECAGRVRPYLALPMVGPRTENFQTGGRFGTFFQLYDALAQALRDWRPNDEHLVINLSLGWDPIKTDDDDARVRRVKVLLERASCMGALIVAGAGSPTGTDGPVEPGAFEEFRAPDARRCMELKVQPLSPPPPKGSPSLQRVAAIPSAYTPLLYAVGAVDAHDQRLMSARRWGQPRLAAFGLDVMVPGPRGSRYTPPLTGTSIATAIVSGVAAAAWSVAPDLDAAAIMELVYRGGVELDGGEQSKRARTEFCLDEPFGPCKDTKVHRVFLCGAIEQALTMTGSKEKLTCDPSVSTEVPKWPSVPRSGTPPQPCRIPGCGLPQGPLTNQAVSGLSSHGVANCPGCTLNVDPQGFATLYGIPSAPDPMPETGTIIKLVLNIAAKRVLVSPFSVDPLPTFGVPMAVPPMTVPLKTSGATLTWSYFHGDFSDSDPPVDIQVITQ
jgi:hypothetical protein